MRYLNFGVVGSLLLILCFGITQVNAKPEYKTMAVDASEACEFKNEWITSPSLPLEVARSDKDSKGQPDSNFCDFYQFSWQAFLYLMSPSTEHSGLRNFEVGENFPVLKTEGNSCSSISNKPVFFVRTTIDMSQHFTSL